MPGTDADCAFAALAAESSKKGCVKEKMAKDKYYGKTLRKNFARHEEVMPMPNLLEIQKKS